MVISIVKPRKTSAFTSNIHHISFPVEFSIDGFVTRSSNIGCSFEASQELYSCMQVITRSSLGARLVRDMLKSWDLFKCTHTQLGEQKKSAIPGGRAEFSRANSANDDDDDDSRSAGGKCHLHACHYLPSHAICMQSRPQFPLGRREKRLCFAYLPSLARSRKKFFIKL